MKKKSKFLVALFGALSVVGLASCNNGKIIEPAIGSTDTIVIDKTDDTGIDTSGYNHNQGESNSSGEGSNSAGSPGESHGSSTSASGTVADFIYNASPSENYPTFERNENNTLGIVYAVSNREDATLDNTMNVASELDKMTVVVQASGDSGSGYGSGVVYSKKQIRNGVVQYNVLTNAHVVEDCNTFTILDSNNTTVDAKLVGYSTTYDVAILTFATSGDEFDTVKFATKDAVKGQNVCAMGTPLDLTYYNTFTTGVISNVLEDTYFHTAFINSGNSGGPLVNLNGELIGLNNAKLSGSSNSGVAIEGMFEAVPLENIEKAMYDILNHAQEDAFKITPKLGITVQNVENIRFVTQFNSAEEYYRNTQAIIDINTFKEMKEKSAYLPDGINTGVFVSGVSETGISNGILEKNDVIYKYNGTVLQMNGENTLGNLLKNSEFGDEVELVIYRNKVEMTVKITL